MSLHRTEPGFTGSVVSSSTLTAPGRVLLARRLVIFALIIIGLGAPFDVNTANMSLLTLIWIMALTVLGMIFIISNTGLVSFGQAALTAAGGYALALCMNNLGLPYYAALVAACLGGGLVGLIYALPSVRVRGPYFAIITILLGTSVADILNLFSGVTKGEAGLFVATPHIGPFTSAATLYYLAFIPLVIAMWFCGNLQRSDLGRSLRVIKAHPGAATAYGIDTVRVQTVGVTVGNILAGLAGGLLVLQVGGASPDSFTLDNSSYFLVAAVVAGTRWIGGAVVGAALIQIILDHLSGNGYDAEIVLGAIMVVSLTVLPNGLVGAAISAVRALRGARGQAAGAQPTAHHAQAAPPAETTAGAIRGDE